MATKSKKLPHQPASTSIKKKKEKYRYCNVVSSSVYSDYAEQVKKLIQIGIDSFDWYAYIYHKAELNSEDPRDSHDHFHILYFSRSPLGPESILKRFRGVVPENLVEFTMSGPGFARYLTHQNRPEKIQYCHEDVVSSDLDRYYQLVRNSRPDSLDLWTDYKKLRVGALTPEEFIEKYRAEMSSMPMYQRFSMYQKVFDTCGFTYYRSASIDFDKDPPIVNYRSSSAEAEVQNNIKERSQHGHTKTN